MLSFTLISALLGLWAAVRSLGALGRASNLVWDGEAALVLQRGRPPDWLASGRDRLARALDARPFIYQDLRIV